MAAIKFNTSHLYHSNLKSNRNICQFIYRQIIFRKIPFCNILVLVWSFSVDLTEYIMDSITKNSPKFKLDCPSFCCLSVSLIPSDNIFLQRNFINKIFEVGHFVKISRYGTKSNLRYCFVSMKLWFLLALEK